MRLTDIAIRALKLPEKGVVYYTDDTLIGFGVRVSEGGTKSFVLTHGPRRTKETLGRVGILTLQEARGEARRRLAEYTLGKTRPLSKAWNAALEEFLEEAEAKNRPSTVKSYRRHLKIHFKFGTTKLEALTPHDFQRALDKLKDRPAERHHAFVCVRIFVRWAYRKHYLDRNPLDRMQAPPASKPRERTLTDSELRKVWHACPDDPFGRIVKLLIICGQRTGETCHILPSMISGDLITLPGDLTKNGRKHTFPFPRMAKPYLSHLSYNGFGKAKARLDQASGVDGWTLHDLRRTFRTKWASLGISRDVAERYINHISGVQTGVAATYDRYTYLPEMREAVGKWEKHLQGIIGS